MASLSDFNFFDPDSEVTITSGQLPHWQQPGATYFITYRTNDSIPAAAMERILTMRNDWLRHRNIDTSQGNWCEQLRGLSAVDQEAFHRFFAIEINRELDQLAGECVLKRPELSQIVADNLKHFDGDRYHLGGFVVMPNHVHILACVFTKHDMLDICYHWKHYQSRKIHQTLNRNGTFYQKESFDHLVRGEEHFEKYRRYLRSNPENANLKSGEYVLYLPEV